MDNQSPLSGTDSYKVVREYLKQQLLENYVIISNVTLTTESNRTAEFDAIILGRYAVYIIEFKSVTGKLISGNKYVWKVALDNEGSVLHEFQNPFVRLRTQKLILATKFRKAGLKFPIIDCVCIYSSERPEIQLRDSIETVRNIFWYKDSQEFLRRQESLRGSMLSSNEDGNITNLHQRIISLILHDFTSHDQDENEIVNRLAGDSTTDAPPPKKKKDK